MNKKNIPNLLTVLRGLTALAIIIFFFSNHPEKFWIIYILFLFSAITDFWDGFLARKWKVVSDFGIRMDPFFDKVLVFSILILVFPLNIIPKTFIAILIIRDIISDILRSILSKRGIKTPAIKSAKYKTAFQLLTINFILLFLIFSETQIVKNLALSFSFLAVIFSLWSGFVYIKRFRLFNKSLANKSSAK